MSLVQGLDALSHKWLARIILKDLKLGVGASEKFLLPVYHQDAYDLWIMQSDLYKVCGPV